MTASAAFRGALLGTDHARCLDEGGKVVDATWEESERSSYFGIPFRFEFVERVTMRNRYYGGVLMPWDMFDPRTFEGVEFRHPLR